MRCEPVSDAVGVIVALGGSPAYARAPPLRKSAATREAVRIRDFIACIRCYRASNASGMGSSRTQRLENGQCTPPGSLHRGHVVDARPIGARIARAPDERSEILVAHRVADPADDVDRGTLADQRAREANIRGRVAV